MGRTDSVWPEEEITEQRQVWWVRFNQGKKGKEIKLRLRLECVGRPRGGKCQPRKPTAGLCGWRAERPGRGMGSSGPREKQGRNMKRPWNASGEFSLYPKRSQNPEEKINLCLEGRMWGKQDASAGLGAELEIGKWEEPTVTRRGPEGRRNGQRCHLWGREPS